MIINTSRDGADSRVESSRTRVSTMDARRLSSFKETSASASTSATRLRARDRDGASKHAFTALANRVRTRAITAHAENAVDGRGRFVQPRRRCETTATRGERATTTRRDRDERLHRARTRDARSDCTPRTDALDENDDGIGGTWSTFRFARSPPPSPPPTTTFAFERRQTPSGPNGGPKEYGNAYLSGLWIERRDDDVFVRVRRRRG